MILPTVIVLTPIDRFVLYMVVVLFLLMVALAMILLCSTMVGAGSPLCPLRAPWFRGYLDFVIFSYERLLRDAPV